MALQIPKGPRRDRPRIVSFLAGVLVVQLILFLATPTALPLCDDLFQVTPSQPTDYLGYMAIEGILCLATTFLLFLGGMGMLSSTQAKEEPRPALRREDFHRVLYSRL